MKRMLVTGFEPFGGERINPSWEAVKRLPDRAGDMEIAKERLCVQYAGCERALEDMLERYAPEKVVLCGQAGGRAGITIECCAINRDHSEQTDNAGDIRRYAPIISGGAAAYFTKFDVRAIVEAVRANDIECAPSFSAGTYVCNHAYYTLLRSMEMSDSRGLFVHVPFIPSQLNGQEKPAMELETIARALEIICREAAKQ